MFPMDSARHEQVVEAFFKCHPQAISDIFREFLLAMQAEETLPPAAHMAQNYETAAANPEIHILPGNLKDARDTLRGQIRPFRCGNSPPV